MSALVRTIFLAALLPLAHAGKEAAVTKTFKFTEDVFLQFGPLPTAIGPNDSVSVLMDALEDFREEFGNVWRDEIESTLQGGACVVDEMRPVQFSICSWKYPDRYDVEELPIPGQCYRHDDRFIQRIYYKIKKLQITCPTDFSYDDLKKDDYTEAAFSGSNLLNYINPPNDECSGDSTSKCLFSASDTAEWSGGGYDDCNAELFISRFVEVPVYLKCLDQGYGRRTANKIIKALDKYFDQEITPYLTAAILEDSPQSFVYNYASPYSSDRRHCAHGRYYVEGNLVDQVQDCDGVFVTKFTYGFDVVLFKDRDYEGEVLPNVDEIINEAFQEGEVPFTTFLKEECPECEDYIQESDVCGVIDPRDARATFAPTPEPTPFPTEGPECDVDTDEGCENGQVCRLSCAYTSSEPRCFDDEEVRDCAEVWEPGHVCVDTDGDGDITASDHGGGCIFVSPTRSPSMDPTSAQPTGFPSLRPTTLSPTTSAAPSEFIEPSVAPTVSSMPTSEPTPIPSPEPTYGETETEDKDATVAPTPILYPAMTMSPTIPDVNTPQPTCPQCIVHPDDTKEDECPIVTTGTCGNGNRGDGICAFAGHCCSEWGWCGTTAEYCESSAAPTPSNGGAAPPSPTYSRDAGQCGANNVGDGFCPDNEGEALCCSDWGYCGSGESYCFTTRVLDDDTGDGSEDGTCGGGGVGNGLCKNDLCCSAFGFCGEGELYCTGQNGIQADDSSVDEARDIVEESPLPDKLKPEFGFRCGFSEVDARSNCKPQCVHHIQCSEGEECWGVQLNYCNTFEEGDHPICLDLDLADNDSRCGYDEASARGHCGPKCTNDDECGEGEFCFPTLQNLCECHEETCPEESTITFAKAKALISPYFVMKENGVVEGLNSSTAATLSISVTAVLLASIGLSL